MSFLQSHLFFSPSLFLSFSPTLSPCQTSLTPTSLISYTLTLPLLTYTYLSTQFFHPVPVSFFHFSLSSTLPSALTLYSIIPKLYLHPTHLSTLPSLQPPPPSFSPTHLPTYLYTFPNQPHLNSSLPTSPEPRHFSLTSPYPTNLLTFHPIFTPHHLDCFLHLPPTSSLLPSFPPVSSSPRLPRGRCLNLHKDLILP